MSFELIAGDLIFLHFEDTRFGNAISSVQKGWGGLPISHVAIALSATECIEASRDGVRVTSIVDLLSSAGKSDHNQNSLLRARVIERYSHIVPKALSWCESQIGKAYNETFDSSLERFYCSQLVVEAFRYAAGGQFFPEHPMNFKNLDTQDFLPFWVNWYAERKQKIPQDEPGSHPATLSLSEKLVCRIW